jgi:signal transduction histidine kinase
MEEPVKDRSPPSYDERLVPYGHVLEGLRIGVCVWHLEQDDTPASLRLVIANSAACRFLGVTRESVLGRRIHEGFPGSEAMPLPLVFTELAMHGGSRNLGEVPYNDEVVKEGVFSIVAVAIAPRLVLVEFTNVTEQKRAQAQLVLSEKMASLGMLVAGIAHELKNPLNFVNNFAELAIELLEERLTRQAAGSTEIEETLREVVDNLTRIRQHGGRADSILNAMLMHARDHRGEPVTVEFNEFVLDHAALAYHGFRAGDRAFTVEFVNSTDPAIGRMQIPFQSFARVVLNLVNNACYAIRERQRRGDPALAPRLLIGTRRNGSDVELTVADNGIGIAPEVRRWIFDPFFTTKPPGEGTGLGLSISYEIVTKELGGSIEVASQLGEGTTFTVRIPTVA